jgi:hypothetical protein
MINITTSLLISVSGRKEKSTTRYKPTSLRVMGRSGPSKKGLQREQLIAKIEELTQAIERLKTSSKTEGSEN